MLGFLDKDGKFFECEYFNHITLANELLQKYFKQEESFTPVDDLCKRGFIVIQSTFVGFAGNDARNVPQLTHYQKEWLEEHREEMSRQQRQSLDLCFNLNELLYEI